MKKCFALVAAVVLCTVALMTSPTSQAGNGNANGKEKQASKFLTKAEKKIPNNYIVVLNDWAAGPQGEFSQSAQAADQLTLAFGGRVKHVYKHALNGFSVEMPEAAARALAEDPRVAFVEEDAEMHLVATQSNPPWGLDRIDQRNRPLSGTYTYNWTGSGVRAYVIDTGIRTAHTQFGGRATNVFDVNGGNGQDCNGHGTHVSGTIGGSTYGVAKSVQLRGVRVFGCGSTTSTSNIIAGVNYVAANRQLPAVANMSVGGPASTSMDNAVQNLINSGVTVAVAAGNSSTNACTQSPARLAAAITVGSTTSSDARSSFSNFGTCVDLFAPGSSILSAWYTSNTAAATLSGTSMASPHVAGVAALYLQANPGASNATVRNAIVNNATTNVLTGIGTGSPNRLLYSLFF
ncbi:MAG TPA: S8 family peptidase [Pyrinomonadaceae bacterium]|nr:S8 family peptidase [Pyrinomonadaceae bacterium]